MMTTIDDSVTSTATQAQTKAQHMNKGWWWRTVGSGDERWAVTTNDAQDTSFDMSWVYLVC